MNLGSLQSLIYKKLGDTTGAFWLPSEIVSYINLGISDIAFRAKCIKKGPTTFNAFASQSLYGMQANLPLSLAITELYFYNIQTLKWVKLRSTSRTELDETNPGWISAPTALPNQFWWDWELDQIYLYPPPDASYISTQCVQAYYAIDSTDLANPTDTPQIPKTLHLAIVDFSAAIGFETRGWMDKANDAWGKYMTRITNYVVERDRAREDDNVISKGYKNRIHT